MKVTITLKNFQQTSFAEIELNEGLTIIRGTNNQGKSSLRRALEAVIFNNPRKTKNYIKNGEKSCYVKVEVEGYLPITWSKTEKEVTYTIGDNTHEKAGRLTLKDVYPDHPFTLFDDKILFNVIKQGKKPVPFDIPSSQVFNIFEELYGVLSTKEDISKFNAKLSEYNTQIVNNNRQEEKLRNKLKAIKEYKSFVDVEKLHKMRDKLSSASKLLSTISEIKSLKSILSSYIKTIIPIDPQKLNKSIEFLRRVKDIKSVKSLLDERKVLEIPVCPSVFEEYNSIKKVLDLKSKLDNMDLQRKNLQKDIRDIKESLPVCPTCKRPF